MDASISQVTIAQQADLAARKAVATFEPQPNPHTPGTPDAMEWARRYHVALLRHSQPEDAEASA